jgi:hypothetical protein
MRAKHWAATGLVLLVLILLASWPVGAQPGKQPGPTGGDIGTRLDRIEKQLGEIQEQLKKLEAAKPGWQKIKETDRSVIFMDSVTGKVRFVYTDGTDRVTEK